MTETSRRTMLTSAMAGLVSLPLVVSGCASVSTGTTGDDQASPSSAEPVPSPGVTSGSRTPASQAGQTALTVSVNGTAYPAHLNGTQAAQSLAARLPLTATFRDYSPGVEEKVTDLDRPLDHDQMPDGDDPAPGDIAYWSPDQRIVLYWGDVERYAGIHVIGALDSSEGISAVQALTPRDEVLIALA